MDQQPPARRTPQQGVDPRTQAFLTEEMFLRRVVGARLPNSEAVDEVIQEVAVALAKAPSVPLDAIRPWLCRVAIRQALLYRRRQGRQRHLQAEYSAATADPGYSSEGDPLLWMLAGERRQQLQEALSRLRPEDEKILILKYVDGYDYRRIAASLEITEHAVANRLRAARQKLRRELDQMNLKNDFESKPR